MGELNFELPASAQAPIDARSAIRGELSDALPAPLLYDLLLAVTELVDNGVVHGPGTPIGVRVTDTADLVRGEVDDGHEPDLTLLEFTPNLMSGLGLRIVDAIATRWGVDGTTVWFEIDRG